MTIVDYLIWLVVVLLFLLGCYLIPKLIITAYYDSKVEFTAKLARMLMTMRGSDRDSVENHRKDE